MCGYINTTYIKLCNTHTTSSVNIPTRSEITTNTHLILLEHDVIAFWQIVMIDFIQTKRSCLLKENNVYLP